VSAAAYLGPVRCFGAVMITPPGRDSSWCCYGVDETAQIGSGALRRKRQNSSDDTGLGRALLCAAPVGPD
jgi:hypothetical protein